MSVAAEKLNRSMGVRWFNIRRYRLRMALIMLGADLLGFGSAGVILFAVNLWAGLFIIQWRDLGYVVVVLLCLALYLPTKLYPGVGLNPAEEIRLVFLNNIVGFSLGVILLSFAPEHPKPNYLALFPLGVLSVISVLASRWIFRILSVSLGLWGAPVVVIGAGREANQLARYFLSRRRLGFIPKYIITNTEGEKDITAPVTTFDREHLLNCPEDYFSSQQIHTALIDASNAPELFYSPMFARLSQLFPRLILVSNLTGMLNSSFQVHDFEGIMGLEANKNVLSPFAVFTKRVMDITLSSLLIFFTSPLWALTILLIRLSSPGPIFFTQPRVGKNRRAAHDKERLNGHVRKINIYKFRTMVVDAEKKLQEYLEENPQAREEWNQTQKLKNDPRIIPCGNFLRKFSIDELPQLINVLKGEMSLVGPRPIMLDQIADYGDKMNVYNTVRPGLTGLWQVSGRNNTSFTERAAFDEYYIHNWSVWLDIYILLRTIWVVLSRDGAY